MSNDRSPSRFETASAGLFGLMMTANVLNYVYQVVMGNALSVSDFGALNAIQAFITIAGIPAGAFLMIASRATAQALASDGEAHLDSELSPIISASALFGLVLTAICLALAIPIAQWLQVDNTIAVAIATLFVGFNCVFNALSGVLQGGGRLGHYGASSVVSMLSKLVFSLLLVLAGFELAGAMAGLVAAPVCAAAYCAVVIAKRIPFHFAFSGASKMLELLKPLKDLLILQAVLAILTNGDVILIKFFFSPEIAGAYSSGMVLGKIPLFAASALVGVLFPFVAASSDRDNAARLLRKALAYGAVIAIACSVVLCFFGDALVGLFFGERYAASVAYLPAISILAVSLTLITIVANFDAASDTMSFFNVTGTVGIVLCIVVVAFWHPDTISVILVLACAIALIAIVNLAHLLQNVRRAR